MTAISNVILVHGAWADGSSWAKVIPLLAAKGFNVAAVQLPLNSFEADVATVRRAIALAEGDRVDPPEVLRREVLARIPQARLHVLPDAGHLLPLEEPTTVAGLLRAFALSLGEDPVAPGPQATGPNCSWCGIARSAVAQARLDQSGE